jgi:hypothetical protein
MLEVKSLPCYLICTIEYKINILQSKNAIASK